ncbi:MAG: PadR family transcriptional regulator [Microthrixaceae bacterium]
MRDHQERGRGTESGPGFGPPFGPGPGFGPGSGRRRKRRGDIRTAVLAVLAEQPRHGYEIIQALEEKSGGAWRPSPGSVYPMLQMLEDEGLARPNERDGKRVYELTDAGRAEATERMTDAGGPPWAGGDGSGGLRMAMMQLGAAARQIGMAGSREQVEQAVAIVNEARKQIYRLLAAD